MSRNTKVKKRRKAKNRNPQPYEPARISIGRRLVEFAMRIIGNEKSTAEEIEKAQKQKNRGSAMILGFVPAGGSKSRARANRIKHQSQMAAARRRRNKR